MHEFDKARVQQQHNKISIASDYVKTLAGNSQLTNLLAKQIKLGNDVSIFSSSPPDGRFLDMFKMLTGAYLTYDMSDEELKTLTSFTKKPQTPEEHYNIVFDDEEVNWCTYDYHVQAGTPAFERFLEEHENNPYKDLMDIAHELSVEFKGDGINIGAIATSLTMKKEL